MILAMVKEQVTLPFSLASESLDYLNTQVKCVDVYGGTGQIISMVESGQADAGICVTEGAILAERQGRNIQAVSNYASSPLCWGVFGSPSFPSLDALLADSSGRDGPLRVGVSRLGSGSHTMASLLLDGQPLLQDQTPNVTFKECHSLSGLVENVRTSQIDFFLWEKFTTQFLCSQGLLAQLSEIYTPWSSFSFIVKKHEASSASPSRSYKETMEEVNEIRAYKMEALKEIILPVVAHYAHLFQENPHHISEKLIESICGHTHDQAVEWLRSVTYSDMGWKNINEREVDLILNTFEKIGLVSKHMGAEGAGGGRYEERRNLSLIDGHF